MQRSILNGGTAKPAALCPHNINPHRMSIRHTCKPAHPARELWLHHLGRWCRLVRSSAQPGAGYSCAGRQHPCPAEVCGGQGTTAQLCGMRQEPGRSHPAGPNASRCRDCAMPILQLQTDLVLLPATASSISTCRTPRNLLKALHGSINASRTKRGIAHTASGNCQCMSTWL